MALLREQQTVAGRLAEPVLGSRRGGSRNGGVEYESRRGELRRGDGLFGASCVQRLHTADIELRTATCGQRTANRPHSNCQLQCALG